MRKLVGTSEGKNASTVIIRFASLENDLLPREGGIRLGLSQEKGKDGSIEGTDRKKKKELKKKWVAKDSKRSRGRAIDLGARFGVGPQ